MIRNDEELMKLISACLTDFKATDYSDIHILSYPKAYGNTAGPFGGIGGNTITAFQTVVIVDDCYQRAIVYLAGPAKKRLYDLKDDKKRAAFWKKFMEQDF